MESIQQNETVDPRYPNTPIGIVRSRDAFLRDLPALVANPKYDRWSVAYIGNERIALAESHEAVIRACRERGVGPDDYYIGCVTYYGGDDEDVDFGFCEFEDVAENDVDSPNTPERMP